MRGLPLSLNGGWTAFLADYLLLSSRTTAELPPRATIGEASMRPREEDKANSSHMGAGEVSRPPPPLLLAHLEKCGEVLRPPPLHLRAPDKRPPFPLDSDQSFG